MKKILLAVLIFPFFSHAIAQDVNIRGAMKNIMMRGDLKSYTNLDTINKKNLYGLGPVEDLKGEILVLDGQVFSSEKNGQQIINKQNKISTAAMFVYSYVEKWKEIKVDANVNNYNEFENLIATIAKQNGYDTTTPFVFKIEAKAQLINYHIIDWNKGVIHTIDNHKQFAYSGKLENSNVILLGFYSDHHHGIFTHHTTNMHLHLLDNKTKQIGHLDNIQINDSITLYLPAS